MFLVSFIVVLGFSAWTYIQCPGPGHCFPRNLTPIVISGLVCGVSLGGLAAAAIGKIILMVVGKQSPVPWIITIGHVFNVLAMVVALVCLLLRIL